MALTYSDIFHLAWSDAWIFMQLKLRVLANCESLQYLNRRPLEPNVQIYVKTMWKLEMHWHIFFKQNCSTLSSQTDCSFASCLYAKHSAPGSLKSPQQVFWNLRALFLTCFLFSASSLVDKRLSTDFTWQPQAWPEPEAHPGKNLNCSLQPTRLKFPFANRTWHVCG